MSSPGTDGKRWPSRNLLWVFGVIWLVLLAIDVWDGDRPKMLSTALMAVGTMAVLKAQHHRSSRWRIVGLMALSLAVAVLLLRMARAQGWV